MLPIVALALPACGGGGGDHVAADNTPASIVMSPAVAQTIASGSSLSFTAQVRNQEGTTLPDVPVTWTSTDPTVAAVDQRGTLTSLANHSLGNTVSGVPIQVLPAGDANCNDHLDTGHALVILRQAVGLTTPGSCAGELRSLRPPR
jgi:hypothetical protein